MGVVHEYDWQNSGEKSFRRGGYGGVVISPLAVVALENPCAPDEEVEGMAPEQISKKVLSQISEVSRLVGVSFEGLKRRL